MLSLPERNEIMILAKDTFKPNDLQMKIFEDSLHAYSQKLLNEYYPKECGSCSFWEQNQPQGNCSQSVLLQNNKLDYQITFADYGCNIWEEDYDLTVLKKDK